MTEIPRVSICLPNLNTRAFLPERFATIVEQTFTDWELLVYDSHSTDGSWDYISERVGRDRRMRAWQGPRHGTPGSWSPCVQQARGEFVYVATSDDTMAADCLEQMVAALDAHPDCDLAHCPLRPIDGDGCVVPALSEWWRSESAFARNSGPLLGQSHVRLAPYDGLLHLLGDAVYISITQLLIRRSLFERIGLFQGQWGSVGDFNWSMRAGLAGNTVHVPGTWGGWRVHAAQATASVIFKSPEHAIKVDAMIADALEASRAWLPEEQRPRITALAARAAESRAFIRTVVVRRGEPAPSRRAFLAKHLLTGSAPARDYVRSRLLGRSADDWLRRDLDRDSRNPRLVPVKDVVRAAI